MNRTTLLKTLLKVLVSGGILYVLLINIRPQTLREALEQVSPWELGGALLFYFVCQFISAWRWQQLAHAVALPGHIGIFYRFYLMGMFFNLFLPTAVGGDIGRAVLVSRQFNSTWTQAFLSILAERLCGLMGLLGYVILSFSIVQPSGWSWGILAMLLALLVCAAGFSYGFRWIEHHSWGHRFIHRFVIKQADESDEVARVWPHAAAITTGVVISILFHGLSIGLQTALLYSMGVHVPVLVMATVYGLSGLASMVPLSLNGIGLREGAIVILLQQWGHVPPAHAAAFSLVWLSVLLLATIPGALLSLQHQLKLPAHKKI